MFSLSVLSYEVLEQAYLGVYSHQLVVNPKSSAYIGRDIILTVSDERFTTEFLADLSSRNSVITRLKIYESETVKYVPYDNSVNYNLIPLLCEDRELVLSNMSIGRTLIMTNGFEVAIPRCLILDREVGNDLTIFGYIYNQVRGEFLIKKLTKIQEVK